MTSAAPDRAAADIAAVADEFFAAIERGDVATIERLYHPDAVIWHNHDQVEQRVAENLRVLGYLCRVLTDRRYDDIRRVVLDDGFVQQHVLRGTARARRARGAGDDARVGRRRPHHPDRRVPRPGADGDPPPLIADRRPAAPGSRRNPRVSRARRGTRRPGCRR